MLTIPQDETEKSRIISDHMQSGPPMTCSTEKHTVILTIINVYDHRQKGILYIFCCLCTYNTLNNQLRNQPKILTKQKSKKGRDIFEQHYNIYPQKSKQGANHSNQPKTKIS